MPKRARKQKKFDVFLTAAVVLTTVALASYQLKKKRRPAWLIRPMTRGYSLVHQGINQAVEQVVEIWQGYVYLVHVREENLRLREEVARLKELNNRYVEYREENKRLRKLLRFKEETNFSVVPGQVVDKDSTNWFRSILINKGTEDGLRENLGVVTHQGLVGRTVEVGPDFSRVLLILDKSSSVAVLIQRSRAEGIMVGWKPDACRINYLPRTADVQVGDVVVTSGLGGVFPKGLLVGKVSRVEKKSYGLFQYAEVIPSVDFSRLEEVLVIVGYRGRGR